MPVENIQSFRFCKDDVLLLDANIWYSVFGPFPRPIRSGAYTTALQNMRINGCKILLDVLVLSEFMNRYARDLYKYEHDGIPKDDWPKFKEFRDRPEFKPIAEEIRLWAKEIIHTANGCCNPDFKLDKAEKFIDGYGKRSMDFNDQVIADTCETNKFSLVTDDGDFKNFKDDIHVLTANTRSFR